MPGGSRSTHRWRRHRRSVGGDDWGAWPWMNPPDYDDDSRDDDGELQELPPSALGSRGCLVDRCTSDYIVWVQQTLNNLGGKLKLTGALDRDTISAINKFKLRYGVAAREYYAGPLLEQALLKAGASPPPPVRRLSCAPTPYRDLLPLLNKYRNGIPLHYLLAWITVESGGKLGDLTKLCERGYFQVHPEESQDLHLEHDRLSTDPDYSVAGGIQLVQRYASGSRNSYDSTGLLAEGICTGVW